MYYLFLIGTLALTAFISYSTYVTARLMRQWRLPSNPLLNKSDGLLRIVLIGLCIGLGVLSGLDRSILGWTFDRPLEQCLLGLAIGLAMGLGLYFLSQWVVRSAGIRFYSDKFVEMIAPRTIADFYKVALALVLVVILEEILFRSLWIGGLSPIAPIAWLVVGVGILFGLLHLPQGIWGMTGAALAGILLGLLFLYEHSLLAPIVAHYVANLIQIALVMRLRRARESQTAGNSPLVG